MPRKIRFHIPQKSMLHYFAAIPAGLSFVLLMLLKFPFLETRIPIAAALIFAVFAWAFSKKILPLMIIPAAVYGISTVRTVIEIIKNPSQFSIVTIVLTLLTLAGLVVFSLTAANLLTSKKPAVFILSGVIAATLAVELYRFSISNNLQVLAYGVFAAGLFFTAMLILTCALSNRVGLTEIPQGRDAQD